MTRWMGFFRLVCVSVSHELKNVLFRFSTSRKKKEIVQKLFVAQVRNSLTIFNSLYLKICFGVFPLDEGSETRKKKNTLMISCCAISWFFSLN